MRTPYPRTAFLVALAAAAAAVMARPAAALESGLMGVRIGASYREVTRRLGPPTGILLGAGGGMMYQTLAGPQAGLPQIGGQAGSAELPSWVLPVRASGLGAEQAQWFYDLRKTKGVSLAIVLNGQGADAVVTDVIVAGFPDYLKGKKTPVRTQKGITLLSSFADVLRKYGYPPMAEIYAGGGAGATTGAAAGGAAAGGAMRAAAPAGGGARAGGMRAGAGMRGGMGGGGMRGGGMMGGMGGRGRAAVEPPTRLASAPGSGYELALTGGMMAGGMRGGMGGGMRGGGMGGGGMRGGGTMGGAMRGGAAAGRAGAGGALPPLGVTPTTPAATETVTGMSDNSSVTFSRDCILTYEGIAFTLQRMRVMRIHVSE